MSTLKERLLHIFIISIFCGLYFLVATISMINSVAFFDLSQSGLMSWSLAIGFEVGAAASLAAIVILEKTNKSMVWFLFLLLTSFQMMANSYHAFVNLENYMGWIELFGLEESEPLFQKRILSIVSGAILPLIALGFIKSLVDYVRPEEFELEIIPSDELEDLEDLVETDEDLMKIVDEEDTSNNFIQKQPTAVAAVEETINTEQTTPVGDPIIIPTNPAPLNTGQKKPQLVSRPFIRGVESKP
jgi:hypothetical protein